jgi:hypothetical protein
MASPAHHHHHHHAVATAPTLSLLRASALQRLGAVALVLVALWALVLLTIG